MFGLAVEEFLGVVGVDDVQDMAARHAGRVRVGGGGVFGQRLFR
ncbi:MAG TPA: hypothetical protein VLJ59_13165 [Mycobacteriales bacterium]|nr:hypothetical protein [Mycobacteriales bacterium]